MSAPLPPLPAPAAPPGAPAEKPQPWSPLPALASAAPAPVALPTIPPCPAIGEMPASPATAGIFPPLPTTVAPPPERHFTDADLRAAISPLLEEPIRTAVRAAAAPVSRPGWFARVRSRLRAIFGRSGNSQENQHPSQIHEVFLIDATTSALVSFASQDAARNSSRPIMEMAASEFIPRLRNDAGSVRRAFRVAENQTVIACPGHFVILMATVHGTPGEAARAGLESALQRIEEKFHEPFRHPDAPLHDALQPFLEACLRLPAPAPPTAAAR